MQPPGFHNDYVVKNKQIRASLQKINELVHYYGSVALTKVSMISLNATEPNYQPEHLFALEQALLLYDFYQYRVHDCDEKIAEILDTLNQSKPMPEASLPKPRHKTRQPNALNFNVREALYRLVGTDLTQIHGIGP